MFTLKNSISPYIAILLTACSSHPNEIWIAEEKIAVYNAVEGKLKFYLQPTDSCEPGIDIAGKVDMYTSVKCNTGEGWVAGGKFRKAAKNQQ